MSTEAQSRPESTPRRRRVSISLGVIAGAASAVGALAMTTAAPGAHAEDGTFGFSLPALDGPPDEYGVFGGYELPNYQLDGSYTTLTFTDRPLLWVPENGYGITDVRAIDFDSHSGWEQMNILGMVQLEAFYSPLVVDGIPQSTTPALIYSILFAPGGATLFGLQYDSAHDVVNVLGPGAGELFAVPFASGPGASLADVVTDSAAAMDSFDLGDFFGWL